MNSGPIRVLLVEDNPGDARLLRETLLEGTPARFAMDHVTCLGDALRRLNEGMPCDVILLDLSLPDSHGLETVTRAHAAAPAHFHRGAHRAGR